MIIWNTIKFMIATIILVVLFVFLKLLGLAFFIALVFVWFYIFDKPQSKYDSKEDVWT